MKCISQALKCTFQALKYKNQYSKQKKTLFLKVYPSKIAIKKGPAELASPNKFVIGEEKSKFTNYQRKYVCLWQERPLRHFSLVAICNSNFLGITLFCDIVFLHCKTYVWKDIWREERPFTTDYFFLGQDAFLHFPPFLHMVPHFPLHFFVHFAQTSERMIFTDIAGHERMKHA